MTGGQGSTHTSSASTPDQQNRSPRLQTHERTAAHLSTKDNSRPSPPTGAQKYTLNKYAVDCACVLKAALHLHYEKYFTFHKKGFIIIYHQLPVTFQTKYNPFPIYLLQYL